MKSILGVKEPLNVRALNLLIGGFIIREYYSLLLQAAVKKILLVF